MAVRLGYDEAQLAKVAESIARAAMQDMRWSVKERHGLGSGEPLHAGVLTVVQRLRSDLGLCVHLHCLITDGAFEERGSDVRFLLAATPTGARAPRRPPRPHPPGQVLLFPADRVPGVVLGPARRRLGVEICSTCPTC